MSVKRKKHINPVTGKLKILKGALLLDFRGEGNDISKLKPLVMVGNSIFGNHHCPVTWHKTCPQSICKSALVSKRSQHILDAQKNKTKQMTKLKTVKLLANQN